MGNRKDFPQHDPRPLATIKPNTQRVKHMKAEKIVIRDYRNITETDLNFGDGVNLIYGSNGAGKTNVLEAIYAYARGKSFRGAADRELVRFGRRGYFRTPSKGKCKST